MELTRDDESTCQVTLLGDQDWLDVQSASVGETVTMDLPEMSVCGDAIVVSIEPGNRKRLSQHNGEKTEAKTDECREAG